jgi:hypothetical protein
VCYLYYLLITDPFLGYSPTITNISPSAPKSKTFLVHAGLEVLINNQKKTVDLSVGESQKEVVLSSWDFLVGIEIMYNTKPSPQALKDLTENMEKLINYQMGFLIWVNWDTPLEDNFIEQMEFTAANYKNVKLFYIDRFSDPFKTNNKKIK